MRQTVEVPGPAWPWGEAGARHATRPESTTNPFLSAAWLRHWMDHRSNGLTPDPVVLDDGTFAPFVRARRGGVRVLRLAGSGDADFVGIVSDRPVEAAWDGVVAELARRRGEWDLLHLQSVADKEAITRAVGRHLQRTTVGRVYETCPYIRIAGPWSEFLGANKNLRRELARWDRRLQELGSLEICRMPMPVSAGVLDECVDVERGSWKWEHGNAALRPGSRRDFLFALLGDAEGPARLWTLRVGSRLAAWAITLETEARWSLYITSYRQDVKNAGSALLGAIVKAAHDAGCASFSLLGGDHHYKDDWANAAEDVHELVCASSPLGAAAALTYRLRWRAAQSPLLRELRDRVLRNGDRR